MAQYLRIKVDHPDTLVFGRMSDLCELFYDDVRKSGRSARKLQVVSDR